MSSKPYVPSEEDIIHGKYHLGDNFWRDLTEAEFRRGIAKIKADVWDEAYRQGIADERTANECQTDVGPNRNNPYRERSER